MRYTNTRLLLLLLPTTVYTIYIFIGLASYGTLGHMPPGACTRTQLGNFYLNTSPVDSGGLAMNTHIFSLIITRGQSHLTKSTSRGGHSPVRGHPRGSKVVPLNSWGRVSY